MLPAGHVPQSTSWVSIAFPLQDDPPFRSCVCITRDLVWVPVPHVLLQVDQEDHEPQAQSTKINEQFESNMLSELRRNISGHTKDTIGRVS